MGIAAYIREIGRGKDGARSLDRHQAHDLMTQVLDGQASDLEVGAFAVAMRVKGESLDELCGFVRAVRDRCIPIECSQSAVILPSYNGARKLPNLTALLALLLAQEGVPVLVHGPAEEPGRVATLSIFQDLGLATAQTGDEVLDAWARHEPAFMTTESLCPPLARLLAVRRVIGLRNPGHTVAKLLDPVSGADALRVVNHTHPEYAIALTEFLNTSGANAMLLRGTEGEPVADPRRLPRLDVFVRGVLRADLSVSAQDGVLTELPVLPRSIDATTTAVYIQSVVSGEKPAPLPLSRQVECILSALRAIQTEPVHELSA